MTIEIFLGTQGWAYRSWVGNFYPARTPSENYLVEYAKQFRAVEIDGTYYAIPRPEIVVEWAKATPNHFRFTAKFPKAIVRDKMLNGIEAETRQFLDTMALLGEKLGPLVLQFPYSFHVDQSERLARYLPSLPGNFRYAVEVRHPDWFIDPFYDLLTKHRAALVLADYGKMPSHLPITADFVYIRLLGNRNEVEASRRSGKLIDRAANLDRWANAISNFRARGLPVWCFANDIYQGHAPTTVRSLMQRTQK